MLPGAEAAELQVAEIQAEFPVGSDQRVRKDIRGTEHVRGSGDEARVVHVQPGGDVGDLVKET